MADSSMGRSSSGETSRSVAGIRVNDVAFDQPWAWLAAGWRDLWAVPHISLAYGLAAFGGALLAAFGLAYLGLESLVPVMIGALLLVGPFLATGLYEKSRRLALGEVPRLSQSIGAAAALAGRLGFLAVILLLAYLIWVRVATLLVAIFLGTGWLPPLRELMPLLLLTPHGLGLLIVGTSVGALFTAIVFAATAISIPMLSERRIDALTAIAASFHATVRNWPAMALWAALIAGTMVLGLASLGVGLVLAFPLIGHATWHAYRDLAGSVDD